MAQHTIQIPVNKATYIDYNNPDTNYGTQAYLYAGYFLSGESKYRYAALLSFDHSLIPDEGVNIVSAALKVYSNSAISSVDFGIGVITGTWIETGVTYNNAPIPTSFSCTSTTVTCSAGEYITLNMSEERLNNEYGIAVRGIEYVTAYLNLNSNDAASNTPYIEIVYEDVVPNAPTLTSPIGNYLNNDDSIRFEWQYNNSAGGDQGAFDLQYSTDDGATWTTVSEITSNNYYDAPANTFPTGNVYWRVRCYNEYETAGPYSDSEVFYAVGAPAAPVLQSIAGNTARPTVSWISAGQQAWQTEILLQCIASQISALFHLNGSLDDFKGNQLAFSRPSPAYLQDGTEVASGQPRYENALFGKGIMAEEGAANKIPDDTFLQGYYDSAWGFHASSNYRALPNAITLAAGTYTLHSAAGAAASVRIYDEDGTDILDGVKNLPQTFTMAAEKDVKMFFRASDGGAWVWSETPHSSDLLLQLEQKPYATSFISSTRADEDYHFDASDIDPTGFTYVQWSYVNDMARRQDGTNYPTVFHIKRSDGGDGIWFFHDDNSANWRLRTHDDTGSYSSIDIADSYISDGMRMFELAVSSSVATLCVDGVPLISINNPKLPSGFSNGYIGSYGGSSHFSNTIHDESVIFNYTATTDEMLSWHQNWNTLIYNTDWMGTAVNAHKVTDFLPDGVYTAQARIKNEYDLPSEWGTRDFILSTSKPSAPVLSVSNIDNGLNLALSNVDAGAYVLIYRSLSGDNNYICIARVTAASYQDYAVANGQEYQYFARAVDSNEAFADSYIQTGTATVKNTVIHAVSDPGTAIELKVNLNKLPKKAHNLGNVESSVYYSGRKYPVVESSEFSDSNLNLEFHVKTFAELQEFVALYDLKETVLYRDSRGRKIYGRLNNLYTTDTRFGFSISFILTQVDYTEEVEV